MKNLTAAAVVLLTSTAIVHAGGLDRSGQGVGIIFKDGNYAQLSFGNVNPSVSGTYPGAVGGGVSGDMAPSYNQLGGGVKLQFNDALSMSLIYDQPWGADVDYSNSTNALTTNASVSLQSRGLTALARYELGDNFSIYGGLRQNTLTELSVSLAAAGVAPAYTATGAQSSAIGYVIGGAYEIPDIALRMALTYSSETNHDIVVTESLAGTSTTQVTMPKSINLDFQTGVTADTLLTAGVRYVNWTATAIDPAGHRLQRSSALQSYSEDSYTFSLGLGRRFTDAFAASATLGWERPQGGTSSNLSPTDGNVSLSLGASYTMDNMEISGGVRYVKIGDATTSIPSGDFTNNSALALGMQVGFGF